MLFLKKIAPEGEIGTVVPNHKELKLGTLKAILELAKLREEDFADYQ